MADFWDKLRGRIPWGRAADLDTKGKLLLGLKIDLAIFIIDWLGRATVLSQLGVTLKIEPNGPVGRALGMIFGIPPGWFLLILVALYVAWVLAPERYPKFTAVIARIQWQDPLTPPDLYGVIIPCIGNSGAPSAIIDYKVSAKRVNGTRIDVDVIYSPAFNLVVNGGRDCIPYAESHLLFARTRYAMVQRGIPISGALICLFRGVQDSDQIDIGSIVSRGVVYEA